MSRSPYSLVKTKPLSCQDAPKYRRFSSCRALCAAKIATLSAPIEIRRAPFFVLGVLMVGWGGFGLRGQSEQVAAVHSAVQVRRWQTWFHEVAETAIDLRKELTDIFEAWLGVVCGRGLADPVRTPVGQRAEGETW